MTESQEDAIDRIIDELRKGIIVRFSGGGSLFDFKYDRPRAVEKLKEFLAEAKKWKS